MGKFRNFVITENIALGNLGAKLDSFYHNKWLDSQIGGALVNSQVSGSNSSGTGGAFELPSTDLTVPQVVKTGRIVTLMMNKNPVYVRLSDGTEANFTYDEIKRLNGELALGKTLSITFQRHPEDSGAAHSRIDHVEIRD